MTTSNALHGLTAVVTGAGRGLGREHALLLAAQGARIVVNDNGAGPDGVGDDATPAHQVVAEIQERGGQAVAHLGSVSDWKTSEELIALAVDTFGGLDILINNAGILRDRTLANMSEQEWDSVIDVHLKGHFCVLRHAAGYWRSEHKAGRARPAAVVNTSSGSGLRGNPGQANYAAAKAGIIMLSLVAARELERYGVRSNAIAPVARTRLTTATPGLGERIAATGKGGFDTWAPENISPLVAYLASPECRVSGRVFTVMGGHIGLQQGWLEEQAFDVEGRGWTVDELAEAMKDLPAGPPAFKMSV